MKVRRRGEWQVLHCADPRCLSAAYRVLRDPRNRELWWVGRLHQSGTWGVAATEPCCPMCGSSLEAESQETRQAG